MDVNLELPLQFQGQCQPLEVTPLRRGHINDTYLVRYADGGDRVLQRLNTYVFPKPEQVMENIQRVTRHLAGKCHGRPDAEMRCLRVIPTVDGSSFHRDANGHCWRMYPRLQPVQSFDQMQTARQAHCVGHSFGEFQAQLADLPAPRLHEVIADFHNTPKRLNRLLEVSGHARPERLQAAAELLKFAVARRGSAERLLARHAQGDFPERITHNDTKLNNLLFDHSGQHPLCVVDLDTVMPGLVHYDFGDMVRTGCSLAAEDEPDLSKVDFSRELFRGLVEGYLEAGRDFLWEAEVEELAFAGTLLTLEVGIRFLTDYLEEDVYFKTHHPEHNLQRARSQFALVARLEAAEPELREIVSRAWAAVQSSRSARCA